MSAPSESRLGGWTAPLAATVALLYVLSCGPVAAITIWCDGGVRALAVFNIVYMPLDWIAQHSRWAERFFEAWLNWWIK